MQGPTLISILRDFEKSTDIKGSFIASSPNGKILATTLFSEIKSDVSKKIFEVAHVFQQFSDFLKFGTLKQYILDGPNGVVIIKKIMGNDNSEKSVYYVGFGDPDLHLPIVKIALINFSKKIRKILIEKI
ncbi:MAG: hypothetical protein ACFFD2_04725 [Promethearchaeota archaeon]